MRARHRSDEENTRAWRTETGAALARREVGVKVPQVSGQSGALRVGVSKRGVPVFGRAACEWVGLASWPP